MPECVRVFCPSCEGESRDPTNPACEDCMCGGHIDINRIAADDPRYRGSTYSSMSEAYLASEK